MTAPEKPNAALGRLVGLVAPTLALGRLVDASEAFLAVWESPSSSEHDLRRAHSLFREVLADSKGTLADVHAPDNPDNEEEA